MSPAATGFDWIDTQQGLEQVVEELLGVDAYALDTEFHRERTYFPQLALLQIAWEPDHLVLIDPLAVDVQPLAKVFASDALCVIHACSQDLEILDLETGTVPERMFDTQVAAGFLGYSTPSLALLHESLLHVTISKGDRLTDWLARPLANGPLHYAASDVAQLLEIRDLITDQLTSHGRLQWAIDECALERAKHRGRRPVEDAWMKCKPARKLSGRALSVAQHVATWREERAIALDVPVRFVLGDLALVGIAQKAPKDVAQLSKIRGVDARSIGDQAKPLLAAVARGIDSPPRSVPKSTKKPMEHDLRPAVSLVSAWISQYAHEIKIDATLLATRHDIEDFIAGDSDARLGQGWRAELVGDQIQKLLAGDAAVAFDRARGIVLEQRSALSLGGE